jgi:uncharacterized metal-binding protein YceD (DUF177 family)
MENLKIYIDRLQNGNCVEVKETLPPAFLDVNDDELLFEDPIQVKAEAYLADDHLVVQLNINTSAFLPCSICNDSVATPICAKNIFITEPLEEIKGAVFDLTEHVRETILLQTPLFTECNEGKCPERELIKKFLKSDTKAANPGEDVNFPFADLK